MGQILLYENVESMVKVMPRIEALYYFVYELAECFHAEDDILSRIKIGILDNQIIKTITLLYKDNLGENVGKVVISIDWDKHFLLVDTDDGKNLQFDLSKSIVDNVVGWKKIVVTHIEQVMKQFNVSSVEGWYLYRTQFYENDIILEQTRKILGTQAITGERDEKINPEFQKSLDSIFENSKYRQEISSDMKKRSFDCGIMKEVSFDIYYKV